jgi:hypothetical protein
MLNLQANEKRVRRLQADEQNCNAGAPGNFNANIKRFLEEAFGYSKYHLLYKEPECSCVQKGIEHRVRLNPETHRWTADPDLNLGN